MLKAKLCTGPAIWLGVKVSGRLWKHKSRL